MEAITHKFQQAIKELTEMLEAFSTEQLNKIPFPNSWTAGQVGHLLKSYGSWEIFKGQTEFADRPYDDNCKTLSDLFLNFNIKLIAEHSDAIYPSDGQIKKGKLDFEYTDNKDRIISFSSRNDFRVLCLDFEFPTLGYMIINKNFKHFKQP